jgi:hypothetical protein
MVNEILHGRHKSSGVGQLCVLIERWSATPLRMNVELIWVADRLECVVAETAGFLASRPLNVVNSLTQSRLTAGARMKAGEQEDLSHASDVEMRLGSFSEA